MKGVLVFVQGRAHFREMIRVVELFRASAAYEPTVLIAGEYVGYEADLQQCAASGIRSLGPAEVLGAAGEPQRAAAAGPARAVLGLGRMVRRVRSRFLARAIAVAMTPFRPLLRGLLLYAFGLVYRRWPAALPRDVRMQRELGGSIGHFLERHSFSLLVLPEDNFHYSTNLWIRAMHERGGAAVVVPFTIADERELLESFRDAPTHDADSALNWLVAAAFPRWVREHKGKRLVMPPEHVLVNEYLAVAPPRPWLINSGHADALAVESEFTARYYRRAGIAERQIRVTGALSDDVACRVRREADARREALNRELGLPSRRRLVLWAVPPNQLVGVGRPGCAFRTYRELVEACLQPLEALGEECNVVLNLHPRIAEESALFEQLRVRVSRRDVAELIPLAWLYVASSSATIRLAVACGIPVINYDVYRYDYADFDGIPGVVGVNDQGAYRAAVGELGRGGEAYERMRSAQAEFAAREMPIDGRAGERLLRLFDELTRAGAAAVA